ncbi:MAG: hypothetical protein ABSA17_04575 [Rhabdochlamydiaceae bacterium]
MLAVTASPFDNVLRAVLDVIKEEDNNGQNAPNPVIETARRLEIAIQNAINMYRHHPPERPTIDEKVQEFYKMTACLRDPGYRRLNLEPLIRHSIDSGTEKGWIPKLYDVNPQYVVPSSTFVFDLTVQFFGRFKCAEQEKYKPTLTLCGQDFKSSKATQHDITFKAFFKVRPPYHETRCTSFKCRLVVPYECGYVFGDIKEFVFDVQIRALPIYAGVVTFTHIRPNKENLVESFNAKWDETRCYYTDKGASIRLDFKSFDGAHWSLTKPGEIPYLKLTCSEYRDGDKRWNVQILSPTGI